MWLSAHPSLLSLQSSDDSPKPLLSFHALPHPHVILKANRVDTQTSVRVKVSEFINTIYNLKVYLLFNSLIKMI